MPNSTKRNRFRTITSEYRTQDSAHRADYGKDELLDALITAAALIARADNWVQPSERGQLLDFLDRKHFLSRFTRAEIIETFEERIRELREPDGAVSALDRLKSQAESPGARLIREIGEEVAAADCRMDPRELRMLSLIRAVLRDRASSDAAR